MPVKVRAAGPFRRSTPLLNGRSKHWTAWHRRIGPPPRICLYIEVERG